MALQHATAILVCVIVIGVSPSLVLSLSSNVDFYNYIVNGNRRLEHDLTKRGVLSTRAAGQDEVASAVQQGQDTLKHLFYFEQVLHGRSLVLSEGTPSHTALINSWSNDEALMLAREGYINSRASYLLSHQLCMRYGRSPNYCGNQLTKIFANHPKMKACPSLLYRTLNGSCNNEHHPSWGSAFSAYSRLLPPAYKDGIWEARDKGMIGKQTSVIEISEEVQKESGKYLNNVTLATASWGSLITYDMAHTISNRMFSVGDPIICCENNKWKLLPRYRHPLCMPVIDRKESKCFDYVRSMLSTSEDYSFGPAQQMNEASHLLDGSGIYGVSEKMSNSMRTGNNGQIRVLYGDAHNVLPHLFSSSSNTSLFAGEIRLNSDVVGAVSHLVLINEHNRVAKELSKINPKWDDEKLFQEARRIVIAEIQHITYKEWLPVILGEKEVKKRGLELPESGYSDVYNEGIAPSVSNSFANGAMRFVLSLLDEQLYLFDEGRTPSSGISLRFSLVKPEVLTDKIVFPSLIRSLATQNCQANGLHFPEAVSKFMFSANGSGFDVLSLDIQRGRDHGIPPYAAFRKLYGLPHEHFNDLTSSIPAHTVNKLKKIYDKVSSIDLIVGGLAETPKHGSLVGPIFSNIIAQQMVTTRVGDKFFYDNKKQPYPFSPEQLSEIKKVTLARLFCDNSPIDGMQPHAFYTPNLSKNMVVKCADSSSIPKMNLSFWKDKSS